MNFHRTVAFVPHVAPNTSTFCPRTTVNNQMRPIRRNADIRGNHRMRRAVVSANAQSGGQPDYDEIAKQLSLDLQMGRQESGGTAAPMPPLDAPSGEQPFEVTTGPNDMPMINIRHAPSAQQVQVFLYGAAVTSWTLRGQDHFWLSETNKWQPGGKAIRGGIPICFPQFGPYGDLIQHGFARICDWRIRDSFVAADTSVSVKFGLDSNTGGENVAQWPYKFDAEYMVTLNNIGLETKLTVTNTDDKPIEFTCAFHNYFKVSSVTNARVFGFENLSFRNRLDGDKEQPGEDDTGAGLQLTSETDRIYVGAPDELAMFDFELLKVLKIKKTPTLPDATLWNPFGAEGADPGWNNFVCIEPSCIANPVKVQPGESWVGAQLLGVE